MNLLRWAPVLGGAILVAGSVFLAGCAFMFEGARKTDRSSSVVTFLYPGAANPLPPTAIPVLRLPLRVGIAFVPTDTKDTRHPYANDGGVSEAQKMLLLDRVAQEFRSRDYIQAIELIPSTYLRPAGGFNNLDQVGNMLQVDVVVLLAYDQVQFTNENILSLAYWTIVGAYIFQGNKNDTHTLMEAAAYDIRSRHLLFRAPGASQVKGTATGINIQEKLRKDGGQGFDQATQELVKNLQTQLELFRERIKRAPETVKIEHRPGYTGGGAVGGLFAGIIVLLGLGRWLWLKHPHA